MRIYIAALYSIIEEANTIAAALRNAGHEITSRWLDGDPPGMRESERAVMDLDDVLSADCLVLMTLPYGTMYKGGGRHVEFGYALGLNKHVAILGDYEHVFCHLPQVFVCRSVPELINHLSDAELTIDHLS